VRSVLGLRNRFTRTPYTSYVYSVRRLASHCNFRERALESPVSYAVIRPGPNCAVAQEIGHPSLSILLQKTRKPVRFHESGAAAIKILAKERSP
jgi:hypothetical protein